MPMTTEGIDYLTAHYAEYYQMEYSDSLELVLKEYAEYAIPILLAEQYIVPEICGPTDYLGTCTQVIVQDVVSLERNFKSFNIENIDVNPMGDEFCDQIKIKVNQEESIELIGDSFSVTQGIYNDLLDEWVLHSGGKGGEKHGAHHIEYKDNLELVLLCKSGPPEAPMDYVDPKGGTKRRRLDTSTAIVLKGPAPTVDTPKADDCYTVHVEHCQQCDHYEDKSNKNYCGDHDNGEFYSVVHFEDDEGLMKSEKYRCSFTDVEHCNNAQIETTTSLVMDGLVEHKEKVSYIDGDSGRSSETSTLEVEDTSWEKWLDKNGNERRRRLVTTVDNGDSHAKNDWHTATPKEQIKQLGYAIDEHNDVITDDSKKDPVIISHEEVTQKGEDELHMKDTFSHIHGCIGIPEDKWEEEGEKRRLKSKHSLDNHQNSIKVKLCEN